MNSSPVTADSAQQTMAYEHEYRRDQGDGQDRTHRGEHARRADRTQWPDSVANPQRTRVR